MTDDCRAKWTEARFRAFDTLVGLRAYGNASAMEQALDAAREDCERYERLLSRTLPTSDISRVNAAQGKWVPVDPVTFNVVEAALGYCEASGGLFDITIGAVSKLWDLKQGIIPNRSALEEAVRHVNWQQIRLDRQGHRIRLNDPEAMMDVGGIAKGWIADELQGLFEDHGGRGWVIDLGGNILVGGSKPDGSPWKVGLRDPCAPEKTARVITLEHGSVVTSGTYERSCVVEGVPYHHILDPNTGMPAPVECPSVSVVCERSLDAEGFSTTLLMLGPSRASAFVDAHPEILQVHYLP